MKTYKHLLTALLLLGSFSLFSQDTIVLTSKDSLVQRSWMAGIGWNFIDDSGDAFNDVTTIRDQWNGVAFPSRISIGRYFKSGLGIEAIASYNRYKKGNTIDGVINPDFKDYFSIDSRLTYDLNKLIGQTAWFDPYVGVGLGYADANDVPRGTYNAVIGFRTWFSDHWGLDFSSSGKWSFGNEASNHIQHAVGVVYQWNIEKGLTKKGEEKVALLEEMEKMLQRQKDSLAVVKRAEEEAAALADRLAREKEAALAAQELEKRALDAKNVMQKALDDLGPVYFAFDSSYLNTEAKTMLDSVAILMNNNPDYNFQIGGHADSRGTDQYNLWLSERRAKRTVEYLLAKGVGLDRLTYNAFGESQLVNECGDGVHCRDPKHQLNRRSDFEVINY